VDDRTALLSNVLAAPEDDTARLVLADWLEEHGEPAFGRFVRAGVVAARYRDEAVIEDPDYFRALRALSDVTSAGGPARWLSALGVGPAPLAPGGWAWDNAGDRVTVRLGGAAGVFTRGLLAELEVTLSEWYAVAGGALAVWPLETARATDVPGLSFLIAPVESGWRLTGRLRLSRRRVPLTGTLLPAAVAPSAALVQGPAEWAADHVFADRDALVSAAAKEAAAIADELKDAAGDRWPRLGRR
jgi:uncharacterized protein (TIGR02996 family)